MAEGSGGAGGGGSGGGTAAVAPAATTPGFSLVAYSDSDGSESDASGSGGEDAPSSVANARPHAAQSPMPPAPPPPPSIGGAPTPDSVPQQGKRVCVWVYKYNPGTDHAIAIANCFASLIGCVASRSVPQLPKRPLQVRRSMPPQACGHASASQGKHICLHRFNAAVAVLPIQSQPCCLPLSAQAAAV